MMNGKNLATALFALTEDRPTRQATMEGLSLINELLTAYPAYASLLDCPAIPTVQRLDELWNCFEKILPPALFGCISLLCEQRKIGLLRECAVEYRKLLDVAEGRLHGCLTIAKPTSPDTVESIRTQLEHRLGKQVELSVQTDPALLGGMTLELEGRILDGSLRHRLRQIKEVMKV